MSPDIRVIIGVAASVGVIFSSWPSAPASIAREKTKTPSVEWAGFGGNAPHTAVAVTPPQPFTRIRWKTKVDLVPVSGHYGSPMITAANSVLVPTVSKAGYRVTAYSGVSGAKRWSLNTDWQPSLLDHGETPPLPAVLTPSAGLAVAGAGGTILMRGHANQAKAPASRLAFYGAAQWKAHKAVYDNAVQVTTPITAGADGSLYFGFVVHGATPAHLSSGIARIAANGHGSWVSATAAAVANPKIINQVAFNCAPALSPDGNTVYITVNGPQRSDLVRLNASTLKPESHVILKDPLSGKPVLIDDSSTASPTIGPDGDVYFGTLESAFEQHDHRGWLLHFNATLSKTKIPGSFGWDNTTSVLPASAVPGYHGKSSYLLVSKYNNYIQAAPDGDGHNEVAVLDPSVSQKDPYANVSTMKPIQTVLSPVQVPGQPAGARYEWCINSAVVDLADDSVIVNNEAGTVYRWDLATNKLAEQLHLNPPKEEAYTPTLSGPDGTVYAINDGTLYAIGR
ncbi:MAG TPA: hypothetical protein VN767_14945 [Streptosporangiaceae bacterium]|nr:hypothetical protein [Streptosporangiaceae bacterium]